MMLYAAVLALEFVRLTGPDGQIIELNSDQIVSLREPRAEFKDHFTKGTNCLIFTTDGKFVAVTEPCKVVHELMTGEPD